LKGSWEKMAMTEELRWTLITGASSGIGAELARVFASRGYPLILTARRHERLEALSAELGQAHGVPIEIMAIDLEDREAPRDLHEMLRERGIEVHTLVNNAGFGLRVAPCKRVEVCRLRWRPRQSLASSREPSLAWRPVTAVAKRRQGGCRPE
jgi:NADP-dependent 3-hydroxy acid dehydrogenase YdfG